MIAEVKNISILSGAFLLLFAVAELLHRLFSVKAEVTRKLVHVGTGLLTLLFPVMLSSHWLVLALCTSFAVILYFSIRHHLLPSIHAIDRESVGSLAYPLAVYICYLAFERAGRSFGVYYLPILILTLADPAAAMAGRKWPLGRYRIGKHYKTMLGSAAFFATACLVTIAVLPAFSSFALPAAYLTVPLVAMVACIAEAVSHDGYDNLTIPFSVLMTVGALHYCV